MLFIPAIGLSLGLYKSNGATIATTAGENPSSSCGKKSSSSAQSSPLVLNKPPVVKKEGL